MFLRPRDSLFPRFIVMLLFLFIIGCSEQRSDKNVPINYNPPPSAWENPNNPYDTMGYHHNEGLDYIISYRESLSCNDSIVLKNQIISFSADYVCSLGWYDGQEDCNTYLESVGEDAFDLIMTYTLDEVIDSGAYNENSRIEMHNLIDLVENNPDSNDLDLVFEDIKDWEDDIINSNYCAACKKQLLGASSVIRYSLHYWSEEQDLGENSDWVLNCSEIIFQKKDHTQTTILGKVFKNFFNSAAEWIEDNWDGLVACAFSDGSAFYYGARLDDQNPRNDNLLQGLMFGVTSTVTTAIIWEWE